MRSKVLSDKEADRLFRRILSMNPPTDRGLPPKRSFGGAFRASFDYYHSRKALDLWKPPPKRYRLAIDDVLLALMQSTRSPMICWDRPDNPPVLNASGPFAFSRYHLYKAIHNQRSPHRDAIDAEDASRKTGDIEGAEQLLTKIGTWHWYQVGGRLEQQERQSLPSSGPALFFSGPTPVVVKIRECQQGILGALARLEELKEIVAANRSLIPINQGSTGHPRIFWKSDFVAAMADLWQQLTTKTASRSDKGPFADLVSAAWASYDDQMPMVSFTRALRERT